MRRGANRNSPAASERSPEDFAESTETASPTSRRESLATKRSSVSVQSPLSMTSFSSTFQQQNRWMTTLPPSDSKFQSADAYPSTGGHGNCQRTHQYDTSFPALTDGQSYSTSSGFPSSNLRSTNGDSWQPCSQIYDVKHEPRYG